MMGVFREELGANVIVDCHTKSTMHRLYYRDSLVIYTAALGSLGSFLDLLLPVNSLASTTSSGVH